MSVLDELAHGIGTRRLGQITSRVQDVGHPGAAPLSVFLDAGVVPRADRVDNHNQLGTDLAKYQLVQPGDLVFNRLRTWQGGFGASRHRGIVSPAYIVARPVEADARYLDYVLHSAPYLAELTRISKWMPPSQFDVLWTDLRGVEVPWCSVAEQRRIADFLDDRVARIDQIITARREQLSMVRGHQEAVLEVLIQAAEGVLRPLQSLTDPLRPIQYGIVLPGPDFEGGVPIIKGGDIGSGRLARLELNRTDPEIERAYVRSRVGPGDMVIAIRGSVGEVAVVPGALTLANLTQDSARIAAYDCDPSWLRAAMESPGVQALMAARITGSTVKGINIEDLRKVPVRVPHAKVQREIGTEANSLRDATQEHVKALHRAIALMQEYKQSLITAAVTGEIDVTTAGGGIRG